MAVTAVGSGCIWTAKSNASWVTVTAGVWVRKWHGRLFGGSQSEHLPPDGYDHHC